MLKYHFEHQCGCCGCDTNPGRCRKGAQCGGCMYVIPIKRSSFSVRSPLNLPQCRPGKQAARHTGVHHYPEMSDGCLIFSCLDTAGLALADFCMSVTPSLQCHVDVGDHHQETCHRHGCPAQKESLVIPPKDVF